MLIASKFCMELKGIHWLEAETHLDFLKTRHLSFPRLILGLITALVSGEWEGRRGGRPERRLVNLPLGYCPVSIRHPSQFRSPTRQPNRRMHLHRLQPIRSPL